MDFIELNRSFIQCNRPMNFIKIKIHYDLLQNLKSISVSIDNDLLKCVWNEA